MKKFLFLCAVFAIVLNACGPAAEDRVQMDRIAKRTSDSIKTWLDSALKDPVKEMGGSLPYSSQPQPAAANAAPTATTTPGQK